MDHKKFTHMDLTYCKQHPERLISCIYTKKDCPHTSRLACVQCLLAYKTVDGFIDVVDVLNNPKLLMSKTDQPKEGKYDPFNIYFKLFEEDPDKFISSFKVDIFKQIEIFLDQLQEGIKKLQKLKAEITKGKDNLKSNEASECEKFRQAFINIMKVDNYHESEEWQQFEATVQSFVLQFEDQQKKELTEAYGKLKQMETVFFQPKIFNSFISSVSESVNQLYSNLTVMEVFSEFTSLCDKLYSFGLIERIQNKKNGWPKVTLLFKGSEHGLNGQTFWQKCRDKGPTIVICKSKSGYVFGGYTPCKWLPNLNNWQKDESKTSFVFSYTRKEIYPITTGADAIYCNSSYGPIFGSDGLSNMDGKCYSNESYKIENPSTHLMGGEKPELVEMEVFLVE